MKLTLIGAGIRTPLLLRGLVRRQDALHLREVVLYDADPERLETMGTFASMLADHWGARFQVRTESDVCQALSGAHFVFIAIRVGQEQARVLDEEIPLRYGVLGQETTGPGGFAMALRTIPVMLDYARTIDRVAPEAWVINFTNPAGLITQALRDHTSVRVLGICDAPPQQKRSLAALLGVPTDLVHVEYVGLNHLGWFRRVWVDGEDRMPFLLEHYEELQRRDHVWRLFEPELVRYLGMLPNEYLYYFYYRREAVEHITRSGGTRGRQLAALNAPLWQELTVRLAQGDFTGALAAYERAIMTRNGSYMARESGQLGAEGEPAVRPAEEGLFEGEGYEGVAMAIMAAREQRQKTTLILNVPNQGAIPGMDPTDVVEVPCLLDEHGPTPLCMGPLPAVARALVEPVKVYERLTVEAAVTGSYQAAVQALAVHPLVASYSLARQIVDDYLRVHAPYLPQFR